VKKLGLAVSLVSLAVAGVYGCSLGLDESKIGAVPDAAELPDGDTPDNFRPPVTDGGTEAGGLPTSCTRDDECVTSDGCLKGRCDLERKACVFDVCLTATCNAGACDEATRVCGPPKPRTFRAATFPVGAGVGCGGALGTPQRCIAAVYPYVFVGTTNGVVAFSASDPSSTSPQAVAVKGVGFLPTSIVASGNRVFLLGASTTVGATSRVQIAVVDVPSDPFRRELVASTILSSFDRPSGDVLLEREGSSAFLLQLSAPAMFPTGVVGEPLGEPLDIKSSPLVFTAGATPVTTSGSRVIMEAFNAQSVSTMSFVTMAGTGQAAKDGELLLAAAGNVTAQRAFGTTQGGAVYWSVAQLTAPPPANVLRAARGHFLVADAAAPFVPAGGVDLAVYPNVPAATQVVGPAVLIDKDTALVSAAVPTALTTSDIKIHKRATGLTPQKVTLTQPVAQLGASASSGLAYVLAAESPTASSVHVFDAACN
jgi:hypothetical protein